MEHVGRRVVVGGRVQGVFFRDACRRQAQSAGVTGWARNLPDGRVEVVLEGDPTAVERVVRWCSAGPPRADVRDVHVSERAPSGLSGFAIR